MRRADLIDRGRRLMPAGGKFGSIEVHYNQASMTSLGVQFYEAGLTATWEMTDDDGTVTEIVSNNPDWTWNTAAGGVAKCKLPGVLQTFGNRANGVTQVIFKNAKKWSNVISVTCDANQLVRFDTSAWPALQTLRLHSNQLPSVQTYEWPNMTLLSLASNQLTSVDTFDWPLVETISLEYNPLTSFVGRNWPELVTLDLDVCRLASLTTHSSWAKMETLTMSNGSAAPTKMTTFETHPEWVALKNLTCTYYALTGEIETHPEWVNMETLLVNKNNGITKCRPHSTWTNFTTWNVLQNNLSAEEIDASLIAIDGCGTSNGTIDIRTNPGAGDVNRSGAGLAAKTSLLGKGWTINDA